MKKNQVKLRQMQGELKQSAWLIIPEIMENVNWDSWGPLFQ